MACSANVPFPTLARGHRCPRAPVKGRLNLRALPMLRLSDTLPLIPALLPTQSSNRHWRWCKLQFVLASAVTAMPPPPHSVHRPALDTLLREKGRMPALVT